MGDNHRCRTGPRVIFCPQSPFTSPGLAASSWQALCDQGWHVIFKPVTMMGNNLCQFMMVLFEPRKFRLLIQLQDLLLLIFFFFPLFELIEESTNHWYPLTSSPVILLAQQVRLLISSYLKISFAKLIFMLTLQQVFHHCATATLIMNETVMINGSTMNIKWLLHY